jgi:hypothetical protein
MNLRAFLPPILVIGSVVLAGLAPVGAKAPAPPEKKRVELGKNVFFETEGEARRVIVRAKVVLREGQLEGLITRKGTKEHEYILAVDADARAIHTALLAARAKQGKPVRFDPKYVPASGSEIKITLSYKKDKDMVTVAAQQWVRNAKTMKPLDQNWVFAGSQEIPDFDDPKKTIYLANQGDIACVCNMETAMLDLPVASPKGLDDRVYDANTDKIPPVGTEVEIILEVIPEKKDK